MSNLLKETVEFLSWVKKTPEDVQWVGSYDGEYAITWDEFEQLANIEYDSGYGGQEVASDLVVVGTGWWLTRSEYDGSESWHFNTEPQRVTSKSFSRVTDPEGSCWASVDEMNRPGGKYGSEEENG